MEMNSYSNYRPNSTGNWENLIESVINLCIKEHKTPGSNQQVCFVLFEMPKEQKVSKSGTHTIVTPSLNPGLRDLCKPPAQASTAHTLRAKYTLSAGPSICGNANNWIESNGSFLSVYHVLPHQEGILKIQECMRPGFCPLRSLKETTAHINKRKSWPKLKQKGSISDLGNNS